MGDAPASRDPAYRRRLMRFFVLSLLIALPTMPFLLGALSAWGLTHPPCAPGGDPSAISPDWQDVTLTTEDGLRLRGYFIPGSSSAAIIIPPAYSGGRGSNNHYAQVFHDAGFNVLTFESRVCTAAGRVSLGYQEIADVEAAYEYLRERGDTDLTRVGLHGFSSAGSTSIMAAARMPQIGAISAEGGYHHFPETLGLGSSSGIVERLYMAGLEGAYRLITGDDLSVLSPLNALDALVGRDLLLVYGTNEPSLAGARAMLARGQALGVNVELWEVPGAGHGNYLFVAREEFIRRVVGFHTAALLR